MDSNLAKVHAKKKKNVWKRFKNTLKVSKRKLSTRTKKNRSWSTSRTSNSNSDKVSDHCRSSEFVDPLPPLSNDVCFSQREELIAPSNSSRLQKDIDAKNTCLKKDLSYSDEDKVLLLENHTTDREATKSSPFGDTKFFSEELKRDKQLSLSTDQAHSENSGVHESQKNVYVELQPENSSGFCMGLQRYLVQHNINPRAQFNEPTQLEKELRNDMMEIELQAKEIVNLKEKQDELSLLLKNANEELKVVRSVNDTLRILEADVGESRRRSRELEETIIQQRSTVDQLQATRENIEQVLSDLRNQSGKLRKALQEKNRTLFKSLTNASERLYTPEDVRRIEIAVKVLKERLARATFEEIESKPGDIATDEDKSSTVINQSNSVSPRTPRTRSQGGSLSKTPKFSPRTQAKMRSDLERKKREAFDIKLKFFEKEMEVSKLSAILDDQCQGNRSSHLRGAITEAPSEQCFPSYAIPEEVAQRPKAASVRKSSPRHGESSLSGGNKPQSRNCRPRSVSMRFGKSPRRKTTATTKKSELTMRWKG